MLDIAEQRNIYVQPEPDQGQISLRVMINRNTMHISRGLERIVMTMQPLSYALAAIVTASYLSPRLSLISCFLFLFLVIPMYRKSSELNENARMYFQKTSANMGKTLRKYINQLEASSLPAGSELKSIGYQYMEEIPVAEHLDRFDNIRLGPARMVLVTSIFMAVTVGIGMLAVGYMLHVERQGWGTALAFMGALILLLRSLQNLGRSLAVLNRYYPQIVDYMEYFRTLEKIVPSNPDELPGTLELQVYKKQIPDSLHNLQLQQGQAVNLVCDRNINRSNLTYIGGAILRACSLGKRYRMEFAAKTPQPSLLSIREHLNRLGSDNQSQIDMAEELKYFGVFDEIDRLPDGFETRLEEDICSSLSVRLSALLYLLPLSNTAGKMVFIDGDLFSEFDETEINHLLKMFHKFYIFVVSNYSRRILLLLSGAVVLSEGNVIGAGTAEWLIDKEIKFDLRASEQAVISEDDMDDLE